MSERQAAILLRRQISQLPRWLAQVRYNGPPPTHAGQLTGKPRDFAANPALSADGRRVVFESYLQKLPLALKRGEISVLSARGRAAAATRSASFNRERRTPRSAYNPTVSADGRVVAFESAEGNLNFAKRYGQIRVFVNDAKTGRTTAMPLPPQRAGRLALGVQPGRSPPTAGSSPTRPSAAAARARSTSPTCAPARASWPAAGPLGAARRRRRLRPGDLRRRAAGGVHDGGVEPRRGRPARPHAGLRARPRGADDDARQPRAAAPRGAIADEYSADPAISRDGRYVAFSSAAGNLAGAAADAAPRARGSTCATCARGARPPSATRAASR